MLVNAIISGAGVLRELVHHDSGGKFARSPLMHYFRAAQQRFPPFSGGNGIHWRSNFQEFMPGSRCPRYRADIADHSAEINATLSSRDNGNERALYLRGICKREEKLDGNCTSKWPRRLRLEMPSTFCTRNTRQA